MKTEELSAIYHELNFWKGFVKTERFLKGWVGNKKTPELQQSVYDFIRSVPHDHVMDVGSGVVSILNGSIPEPSTLLAIDPLGDLYRLIFDYDKYKIDPPIALPCEELVGHSDIVHMSNALDHTQDPKKSFERLWRSVKPGGVLIIQGFENEAIFERYEGFHKWNLTVPNDDHLIMIENKAGEHSFLLPMGYYEIPLFQKVQFESKTWFIVAFQKDK